MKERPNEGAEGHACMLNALRAAWSTSDLPLLLSGLRPVFEGSKIQNNNSGGNAWHPSLAPLDKQKGRPYSWHHHRHLPFFLFSFFHSFILHPLPPILVLGNSSQLFLVQHHHSLKHTVPSLSLFLPAPTTENTNQTNRP